MNQFSIFLLAAVVVVGLSFFMMNIRYIFTGREFRGTCASNNPYLKSKLGECNVCGKTAEEDCKMPEIKAREAELQ